MHDPPGNVAVTCWELEYHNNLHKRTQKTKVHYAPPIHLVRGLHVPSTNQVWLLLDFQVFRGDPNNENQHFPANLTSDDP